MARPAELMRLGRFPAGQAGETVGSMQDRRRHRIVALLVAALLAGSLGVPLSTPAATAAGGASTAPYDRLGANIVVDTEELALAGGEAQLELSALDDEGDGGLIGPPPDARITPPRDYTPEEIRSSKPFPAPPATGSTGGTRAAAVGPTGPPGADPPGLPSRGIARGPTVERSDHDDLVLRAAGLFVSPGVQRTWPFVTIGKLLGRHPVEGVGHCTATSIGNAAVWAAAHCFYAGGGKWVTDLVFVPATRDGSTPFGQWREAQRVGPGGVERLVFVPRAYAARPHPTIDYGGMVLQRNREGKKIGQVVGFPGFVWNVVPVLGQPVGSRRALGLGYSNAHAGGNRLYACPGTFAVLDVKFERFGPSPVGLKPCDLEGGSSGGPFLTGAPGDARLNYLGGNMSYDYPNQRPPEPRANASFSPYFNTATKGFKDFLVRQEPPALERCGRETKSGGQSRVTNRHEMGTTGGAFEFEWQAFSIPDRFIVRYEGRVLLDTGKKSGSGLQRLTFGPGRGTVVEVEVIADESGTEWRYTVDCPGS